MKVKRKLDGMLVSTFLTAIFYSMTYPYIHREIMAAANDTIIAINEIVNCLSIIFFGTMWNKQSQKLFRIYPLYCALETILSVVIAIFVITTNHIIAYYILDSIVFSIVTRNILCGSVKLKAIRYNTEKLREHFDNDNNSYSSAATIIGSVIAIFLNLDFNTMICIATFGSAIDNIFYIFIFYNTKKHLD